MRVAVFGKPGGGKSTLAEKIAAATGLPLHQLDLMQFKAGGEKVPDDDFSRRHAELLTQRQWVLDGFGNRTTFESTVQVADMLVYVERPIWVHYWWVTKPVLKSPVSRPLGWPEGSPILRSTFSSYRFLKLSRTFWTPELKAQLLALQPRKRVHVIRRRPDEVALMNELRHRADHR